MKKYEDIKNEDLYFSRLGFEITRKCNMDCIHCFKGESKNETITKEIIDKTLDSVKNNEIGVLHIFGGEPTLELDMVDYLIDDVIERNMLITECLMTTNGRVEDIRVFEIFDKLGEFLNKNNYSRKKRKEIKDFAKSKGADVNNFDIPCTIYISEEDHANLQMAINTYNFFKKYENKNVRILWQSDDRKDLNKENLYIYMGRAEENYNILKKNHNYRIKVNKYALRDSRSRIIEAPIYICTNGNVVSSRTLSYDKEDIKENVICNILTDDLFDSMKQWNFKYPLNQKQRKIKEWCKTEIFNFEHGVKQIYKKNCEYQLTNEVIQIAKSKLAFLDFVEKTKRNLHEKLPYLTYDELQMCADSILELKLDGKYLNSSVSGYEPSANYIYDEKDFKESIQAYEYLNNSRKPKGTNLLLNLLKNLNQIIEEQPN